MKLALALLVAVLAAGLITEHRRASALVVERDLLQIEASWFRAVADTYRAQEEEDLNDQPCTTDSDCEGIQ